MESVPHYERYDWGGTRSSPGARTYDEFLSEMVDHSFAVWPELVGRGPRFGTAHAYVLDAKTGAHTTVCLDLWDVVLDFGDLPFKPR